MVGFSPQLCFPGHRPGARRTMELLPCTLAGKWYKCIQNLLMCTQTPGALYPCRTNLLIAALYLC